MRNGLSSGQRLVQRQRRRPRRRWRRWPGRPGPARAPCRTRVPSTPLVHGLVARVLVAGDAEVGQHDRAVVADQDVGRLHVAVNDAAGVGVREGVADGCDRAHGLLVGQLGAVEAAADDQLRDQVRVVVVLLDAEARVDVGVLELAGGAGLPRRPRREALDPAEHLDGHLAALLEVAARVDGAESAPPERPRQQVAAGDGLAGQLVGRGDGCGLGHDTQICRSCPDSFRKSASECGDSVRWCRQTTSSTASGRSRAARRRQLRPGLRATNQDLPSARHGRGAIARAAAGRRAGPRCRA